MRRFLLYWLPALAWTAVVLTASSDSFSDAHTADLLQRIVTRLFGWHLDPDQYVTLNFVTRKTSHPAEYGILAALWFRAVRGEERGWQWRWSLIAIGVAIVIATIDEIHQSFVPSRTGTWHDVVLDTGGAFIAQLLVRAWLVLRFRRS